MDYNTQLKLKTRETGSIVCMGIDPVLERIPIEKGSVEEKITKFYTDILAAIVAEDERPAIVKPNYAFFAQYGWDGLRALKSVIEAYQNQDVSVILDGKRGDIGKSSAAYAREIFDFWGADATTIAPYMGSDSVEPFLEYTAHGKGVYILDRTSNKGAADLQNLKVDNIPIYLKTAEKIMDWAKERPGVGAVVGATSPDELRSISEYFADLKPDTPLLIPGVGAQGGSAKEVASILKGTGQDLALHRINSSSGINFAFIKAESDDYAGAAVKALKELNREIGAIPKT
ncbi:MAG: orotidine-5'-phosphate decarboxylase [Candidatus Altiarchaeota archaeon]